MLDNKHSSIESGSAKKDKITEEEISLLKEEGQKLLQENIQIKTKLQSEQLLHNNLYKQWKELKIIETEKELQLQKYKQSSRKTVSRSAFNAALVITSLLTILTLYNLFFNFRPKQKELSTSETRIETDTTAPLKDQTAELSKSTPASLNNIYKRKDSTTSRRAVAIRQDSNRILNTRKSYPNINTTVNSVSNPGLYKVKAKAYFYNEPDSSTRRNAFINHWNNSYATLKALDDKNGFIYVVFTNHIGQTSKGWLRKFDLYPVNEEAQQ